MASPNSDDAREEKPAGILGHFSALIAAKLGYLRARLKLAGIEGKEAGIHVGIILGLAICALVAVIFGYFLLVIGLVFLISLAFGGGNAWIWVLMAAAGVHFLIALILLLIAKARLGIPFFPLTLDELKKDQEWLKTTIKPN